MFSEIWDQQIRCKPNQCKCIVQLVLFSVAFSHLTEQVDELVLLRLAAEAQRERRLLADSRREVLRSPRHVPFRTLLPVRFRLQHAVLLKRRCFAIPNRHNLYHRSTVLAQIISLSITKPNHGTTYR